MSDLKEAAAGVKEAFADLKASAGGLAGTLSAAFGRCPQCKGDLVTGYWLKWCDNRACQAYVAPK